MKLSRPVRLALAFVAASLVSLLLVPMPAAQAASYVPISGAGSTWSQVAVDAWRADVRASGVVVNYAGTGSTDGRSQYIQGTVDFADSEIPFQNPPEPGQQAEIPSRSYAYLPIVAGGTSFMYNLTVAGKRVTDLRLSGPTLAKIFTGQITNWDDPAITKDYGKKLPSLPIIPVVRSDGAGASAQFTLYMQNQAPSIYCPFIRSKLHLSGSACPSVSFYPSFGNSKAQNGSNGVANYVSASYGAGSIGYDEYAYAKRLNFPVVSLLNKGGYFSQPTAGNVAVALRAAKINPNLTQNLTAVYNNKDPRAYPMSSYSYMIVPTSTQAPFNADKGKTLSTFVNYFLCTGQQKADILGYSPLPVNLVEAGFKQVRRIPGHVDPPAIGNCHNPALNILQTAPQPNPCMKLGSTCTVSSTDGTTTNTNGTPHTSNTGNTNTSGNNGGTNSTGGNNSNSPGAANNSGGVDPLTGAPTGGSVTNAGGGLTTATGTPVTLAAARSGQAKAIGWVVAAMLILTVLVPPFLISRKARRSP